MITVPDRGSPSKFLLAGFITPPFLLVLVLILANGCVSSLRSGSDRMDALVMVEDASGISGCSWVFTTIKGKKMIPVEGSWPLGSAPFRSGERLMIQFVPLEGGVNPCLLEADAVKVMHYRSLKEDSDGDYLGSRRKSICCAWTQDAFEVPWMEKVIRQTDPYRITRFGFGGLAAYRFESAGADLIFDCRGNMIDDGSDLQARSELMSFLDDAFVILVRNQRS